MLSIGRGLGVTPRRRLTLRRWELWSIPASACAFLLVAEFCAVGVTAGLLLNDQVSRITLIRFVVLLGIALGYGELATRSERMKQYLGNGKVAANPMSVWSFAAVLTMPAGWAAALVGVLYARSVLQTHRDKSGRLYRVIFTAAVAMLAQLATATITDVRDSNGVLHEHLTSVSVFAGLFVFTATSFAVLLFGMWLAARPPTLRVLLPDRDAVGYEFATLVLGVAAAEFLIHSPGLLPLILVLVGYVHRSSVVKALQHAARTDAKTGLLNATAWNEHATGALSRSARTGRPVAVLLVDIDHFKHINDTHGHLVGDQVLIAVAACLRRELRGHDGLGRFGGDEFVAILEELDPAAAEQVGHRLRAAIRSMRVGDGVTATVSVSIGLAHANAQERTNDIQPLLRLADAALYRAKSSGRDHLSIA